MIFKTSQLEMSRNSLMSNKEIVGQIKKLARLMELHGENDFKIRTYQNAIQRLERVDGSLSSMSTEELQNIDGIGNSIASLVQEISTDSVSADLVALEAATPDGLLELMNFRGLGTKKLALLWKEFGVTGKTEFRNLLDSGKLLSVKGFGEKTINTLKTAPFNKIRQLILYRRSSILLLSVRGRFIMPKQKPWAMN